MAGSNGPRTRRCYSHDRLERLVGADIRNADEIHPEWLGLAVGDLVRTYRPVPRFEPLGWIVAAIEPERVLIDHEPEIKSHVEQTRNRQRHAGAPAGAQARFA
jgi:hypothetical protein